MPISCKVEFDNSTVGSVFGTYPRGQFKGDTDVAGQGVSWIIFFARKKTLPDYDANSLPLTDSTRSLVPGFLALDTSSFLSSDGIFLSVSLN